MERRALIAVAISLLILVLYQEFVLKRFYPPKPAPAGPQVAAPEEEEAPVREPEAGQKQPETGRPEPEARPATAVVGGRDVVVETDLYRAVFTTAGARLKSLEIKRYRSTVSPDSPPLDLVLHASAEDLPLGIELRGEHSVSDREAIYDVDRDNIQVGAEESATFTFTGHLDGALLTKRIEIRGDRYLFDMQVEATDVSAQYTQMGISWNEGHGGPQRPGSEVLFDSVIALQGPKLRREAFKDLDAGMVHKGDIAWVGYSGRYFVATIVPDAPEHNDLWVWMKRRASPNATDAAEQWIETQLLLPPGKFSTRLDVYVGPKDINLLEGGGTLASTCGRPRLVHVRRAAAAARAAVLASHYRQLRRRHHPPHGGDQASLLPAHPEKLQVDARDAEAAAPDGEDPRALQGQAGRDEHARSWSSTAVTR